MLGLEKGKLVSTGGKTSETNEKSSTKNGKSSTKNADKNLTKNAENAEAKVSAKKVKKEEKKAEKSKKSSKTPENHVPSEKQIEKFLVKMIKKANLEKLTMKQVKYFFEIFVNFLVNFRKFSEFF